MNISGITKITDGQIISENSTAIYNTSYMATITLGEYDENAPNEAPSTTSPVISGGTYGIQNEGTFNFYDGVIIGQTLAISGKITAMPENYAVKYENNNKKATLKLKGNVITAVTYDGQDFSSLETPIELISNNSKTGVLLITDGITLENQLIIPEGVEITFVMQGHSISYDKAEPAIVNNGTLIIIDHLDENEPETIDPDDISTIMNTAGTAIQNNGTLALGKTREPHNPYSPIIMGVETAITGNPATIYDGGVKIIEN